jgi:hypothetical protein
MNLDLTDEQASALERELTATIDGDRYPIQPPHSDPDLREILRKLRPEPEREPLPPIRVYQPPRLIRGRRRRGLPVAPGN